MEMLMKKRNNKISKINSTAIFTAPELKTSTKSYFDERSTIIKGVSNIENHEEARYNLATRIMSNGVEVIIASDKNKPSSDYNNISSIKNSLLLIVPSQVKKPLTLAPSTLKNQMILMMPSNIGDTFTVPINTNLFVTKTCLTTYTYRTTYLHDGTTTVESQERVIANIATEERNYPRVNSTASMGVTLTRTPQLAVGVFPTTYSYFYTLHDGESTLLLTSDHTVLNTITGPDDFILFLQPSEAAMPVYNTNTYYNKIIISKTLNKTDKHIVVTSPEVLTQIIVTESLPPRSTSILTSYYALDIDETISRQTSQTSRLPLAASLISNPEDNVLIDNDINDLHIYATKTFLTTFTYFTTTSVSSNLRQPLVQGLSNKETSKNVTTKINSHTRIIENVITEAIPTSLLKSELIKKFHTELKKGKNQRRVFVTLATLLGGQTLQLTAMNMLNPSSTNSEELFSSVKSNTKFSTTLGNMNNTKTNKLKSTIKGSLTEHQPILNWSNENKNIEQSNTSNENDSSGEGSENKPTFTVATSGLKKNSIQPTKIQRNVTAAITTSKISQMPVDGVQNIFHSINLKGLTVLRPVFNAMADLLQSKLVIPTANDGAESKHAFKNTSSYLKHENPVYIPFQNTINQLNIENSVKSNNIENIFPKKVYNISQLAPPQSLHIRPPQAHLTISDDNWMFSNKDIGPQAIYRNTKPQSSNQQALINGGIPIRPGEVITTNSDVIVGRPNGIQQPKIFALPSNTIPLRRGTSEQTIFPLRVPETISYYNQIVRHPNKKQKPMSNSIFEQSTTHTANYDNILRPAHSQNDISQIHYPIHQNAGNFKAEVTAKAQLNELQTSHLNNDFISESLNSPPYIAYQSKINSINNELRNKEVLEIKRIPQVFTTDLPPRLLPFKTNNKPINQDFKGLQINSKMLPQVDEPFLRDIHLKTISNDMENYFHKSHSFQIQNNLKASSITKPILMNPFTSNFRKHSNHQQINLKTNELHHNIAINVPPITFKKESEYPYTTPIKGVPLNNGHIIMPFIKIPSTEPHVQVNLTMLHRIPFIQRISYKNNNNGHPHQHFKHNQANPFDNSDISQSPLNIKDKSPNISYKQKYINFNRNNGRLWTNIGPLSEADLNYNKQTPIYNDNNKSISKNPLHIQNIQYNSIVHQPTFSFESNKWNNSKNQNNAANDKNSKIIDQTAAYSSLKNNLLILQEHQFSNLNNRKSNFPVLNSETAFLINNLDEPIKILAETDHFNISSSSRPQLNSSTEAIYVENFINQSTMLNVPTVTKTEMEFENIHNSTFNTKTGTESLRPNFNKKNSTNFNTSFVGVPFSYTHMTENISPTSSQLLEKNVKANFFIANGEGFKSNNKYTNDQKNSGEQFYNSFIIHSDNIFNNSNESLSPKHVSNAGWIGETKDVTNFFQQFNNESTEIFLPEETNNLANGNSIEKNYLSATNILISNNINQQLNKNSLDKNAINNANISIINMNPPRLKSKIKYSFSLPDVVRINHPPLYSSKSYMNKMFSSTILPLKTVLTPTKTLKPLISTKLQTNLEGYNIAVDYSSQKDKSILTEVVKSTGINFNGNLQHLEDYVSATLATIPTIISQPHSLINTVLNSNEFSKQTRHPIKYTDSQKEGINTFLEVSIKNGLKQRANSPVGSNTNVPIQEYDRRKYQNKVNTQRIRYMTNITTATETSILITTVTNHEGFTNNIITTTTVHLTKTFTTSIVDTVTKVHTLIQPTRVIESHIIVATKTTTETETHIKTIENFIPNTAYSSSSTMVDNHLNHKTYQQNTVVDFQYGVQNNELAKNHISNHVQGYKPESFEITNNTKDNIFVVMTNKQSNVGLISDFNKSGLKISNGDVHVDEIELHYDENVTFDVATRDEAISDSKNKVNNVILGRVLGETSSEQNNILIPPSGNHYVQTNQAKISECYPVCKSIRNEICIESLGRHGCICRPGFARMFPDRPCKPTYTYIIQIPIRRIGNYRLNYNKLLNDSNSQDFKQLAEKTHDAIDRMIKQSDFRDVYHGVHFVSFISDVEQDLNAKFLLQLSEIDKDKRMESILKKDLRMNNCSIGGTELYTNNEGTLLIADFNECSFPTFNDCSSKAICFNLEGTYTCNCIDGYTDISENPIYPGRECSMDMIGCEKCNYHGKCTVNNAEGYVLCECFSWYSGSTCQLNLKILLIVLIAVGTFLFILLLFCILLIYTKRRNPKQCLSNRTFNSIHAVTAKTPGLMEVRFNSKTNKNIKEFLRNSSHIDKRAMIKDTSSESSQSSLPYVLKVPTRNFKKEQLNQNNASGSKKRRVIGQQSFCQNRSCEESAQEGNTIYDRNTNTNILLPTFTNIRQAILTEIEQSDRSLTVMIPRAKYHPSVLPQNKLLNSQMLVDHSNLATSVDQKSNDLRKDCMPKMEHYTTNCRNNASTSGALISAGFEVSAIVNENVLCSNYEETQPTLISQGFLQKHHCNSEAFNITIEDEVQDLSTLEKTKKETLNKVQDQEFDIYKSEELKHTMNDWLDNLQPKQLSTEARSFDETIVQITTKCIKQGQDDQKLFFNEEANTMAEREIGSTFLLPHTHLYKSEKESDVSGFDSF